MPLNHADKRNEIATAWSAARPLTADAALSIAEKLLADHPKEREQFQAWFKKCGDDAVAGVNR